MQFGGIGAVLLSEVPPNCTQMGEGPVNAACSFNFFRRNLHDGGMAVEAAVHFFTTADHFDTAPVGGALGLSRLDNVQEAYFILPLSLYDHAITFHSDASPRC